MLTLEWSVISLYDHKTPSKGRTYEQVGLHMG